jgi:hypothetical protein
MGCYVDAYMGCDVDACMGCDVDACMGIGLHGVPSSGWNICASSTYQEGTPLFIPSECSEESPHFVFAVVCSSEGAGGFTVSVDGRPFVV